MTEPLKKNGLRFISLYSGAGGMDLGFYRAGFTPVWANEMDRFAVETYNQLIPGHVAHSGDIRKQTLPRRGSAEVVIGGPPCQGFSVAGKMDLKDPRSEHVWEFMKIVKHINPVAFVMENVKSLAVNERFGEIRERLMRTAESLGYHTELLILNAADFGVPQARERMFLIGVKGKVQVKPIPVTREKPPSIRDAFASLPPFGEKGNDSFCRAIITTARKPVLRKSPFAGMLFNGQGRPLNLDAPALTLPATMGGNRTPIIDQLQLEKGGRGWVEKYHAHLMKGEAPEKTVPKNLRRITVEEAAAIQTFPPHLKWAGPQSAKFRQIGNAVPPTLAFHVATALAKALKNSSLNK